jgi:hypothetical protein
MVRAKWVKLLLDNKTQNCFFIVITLAILYWLLWMELFGLAGLNRYECLIRIRLLIRVDARRVVIDVCAIVRIRVG